MGMVLFSAVLAIIGLTISQILSGTSWQLLLYIGPLAYYLYLYRCCLWFSEMKKKDDKLQLDKQLETVKEDFLSLINPHYINENKNSKNALLASQDGLGKAYSYFVTLDHASVERGFSDRRLIWFQRFWVAPVSLLWWWSFPIWTSFGR